MSNIRDNSQQDRRVYVGNLSYDVKWHHLKDFMRQGGSLFFFKEEIIDDGRRLDANRLLVISRRGSLC